jgi:hypothetical protein
LDRPIRSAGFATIRTHGGGIVLEPQLSMAASEGLVEVGEDVVDMLDSDRQSNITIGDTGRRLLGPRKACASARPAASRRGPSLI